MTSKLADMVKTGLFPFDKVSMMDSNCWHAVTKLLSEIDHARRPELAPSDDVLGAVHVILFGVARLVFSLFLFACLVLFLGARSRCIL